MALTIHNKFDNSVTEASITRIILNTVQSKKLEKRTVLLYFTKVLKYSSQFRLEVHATVMMALTVTFLIIVI